MNFSATKQRISPRYWKPFLLLWARPPNTTGVHLTRPGSHSWWNSRVQQVWCISLATEAGGGSRERPAGSDRPENMGLEESIPNRDHLTWRDQHPPYSPQLHPARGANLIWRQPDEERRAPVLGWRDYEQAKINLLLTSHRSEVPRAHTRLKRCWHHHKKSVLMEPRIDSQFLLSPKKPFFAQPSNSKVFLCWLRPCN